MSGNRIVPASALHIHCGDPPGGGGNAVGSFMPFASEGFDRGDRIRIQVYGTRIAVFCCLQIDSAARGVILTPFDGILLALSHASMGRDYELREVLRESFQDNLLESFVLLAAKKAESPIGFLPLLHIPCRVVSDLLLEDAPLVCDLIPVFRT